MLKLISNMPIFRRLFVIFTLAVAIPGIAIVLLGGYYLNSLNVRGQAVQTSFDAQNIASQQQTNLQTMNALLQTRFAQIFASLGGGVQDPSLYASGALIYSDILARQADFDQTLTNYQGSYELATSSNMSTIRNILLSDNANSGIISNQQTALKAVISQEWPNYKTLQDQELNQLALLDSYIQKHTTVNPTDFSQKYEQAYLTLYQADRSFTSLRNDWLNVVNVAAIMGKTVTAVGPSETSPVLVSTLLAFLFITFVVVIAGIIVNLTITRPLSRLALLTRRIIKGDTTARAKVEGRDEIAMVASSMNNMLNNIVRLIQEAQSQRDDLQAQVEKLVGEVSGIGEGDLRIQAEVTIDALGVLADSFNYMVEELSSLVVRVKIVAHEVKDSTTRTFEHMAQLVEKANMQIHQIARAGVEVEQMANSSRQVAEYANLLYKVQHEARRTAQSGREAVDQTVEGMGRIHTNVQETANKVQVLGERSREINNIVEVISNIAIQTNRLALDAAIQASMACENGKGFGAVAAEIRHLAENAKGQTNMIARIVRSVHEDINSVSISMNDTERETSTGTQLAHEAGTALGSIFAVVERQAREIERINQMATQQLQSSSTVVQIMQAVSNSTQQSNAGTRKASQNMERLARLAEQLLTSVEAFKLRENAYNSHFRSRAAVPQQRGMNNSMTTVSEVSHQFTGSPQPQQLAGSMYNNLLAPASPATPYPIYPVAPHQQNNSQGRPMQPRKGYQQ
ncbi:MAG: hypothetical protein NVSMB27_07710 [Ktedonobacteraceae bacterium]